MIRTIVVPDNQEISIHLPKQFVGKEVEIIAFSIEELKQENRIDEVLTHFASENTLAKDWLSIDEDIAWQSL